MCLWYNIMSVFMAHNKYTWHGTQWLGHIILLLHEKLAYTSSEKDHLIAMLHPCRMMVLLMAIQTFLILQVEAGIHLPLTLLCDVFYSFLKSVSRKKKQRFKHSWYLKNVKSSAEKSRWRSVSRITYKCLFMIFKWINWIKL